MHDTTATKFAEQLDKMRHEHRDRLIERMTAIVARLVVRATAGVADYPDEDVAELDRRSRSVRSSAEDDLANRWIDDAPIVRQLRDVEYLERTARLALAVIAGRA